MKWRFAVMMVITLGWMLVGAAEKIPAQTALNLDALPPCDFGLESDIAGLQVGAVIVNLDTGNGCIQNPDQLFPVASVLKIFVSGAYYQAVAQGWLSPSETMRFDQNYYMEGEVDCLSADDIGRDVTLRELADLMITCSDNAATWMLMDALGWPTVQYYITTLGIPGIGEVIPYAQVDRLKLAYLDSRWNDVPLAMASRFLRARDDEGLEVYIRPTPRYSGSEVRAANQHYFDTYAYNTATPRAIADYLLLLREHYTTALDDRWEVANGVLGEMLDTPRLYSTQYFPGTVYVGAKNGFDMGMIAEANFTIDSAVNLNREPKTIAVIFTQQTDLSIRNVQQPRQTEGVLNQFLWDISPQITTWLFPDYQAPEMVTSWTVNTVRFGVPDSIDTCWYPYRDSGFDPAQVPSFESCLSQTPQQTRYSVGDEMSLGVVLKGLGYQETRLTFIYIAPDGTRHSYQTKAAVADQAGINWFHPLDQRGTWTLEIYVNLELAYASAFEVT